MRRVFYLFIYFLFNLFFGSDMTIKLKLYFKILFRCEQNLSEESKMFTMYPTKETTFGLSRNENVPLGQWREILPFGQRAGER